MRATRIIYRTLTQTEFKAINDLIQSSGGGSQTYIDFPKGSISDDDWIDFLGSKGEAITNGYKWTFKVHSLSLVDSAQEVEISSRRETTNSLREQNKNRIFIWSSENSNFPSANEVYNEETNPICLYLLKDENDAIWAGWYYVNQCNPSWYMNVELAAMFYNKGKGACGYIKLSMPIPFDQNIYTWPFMKKEKLTVNDKNMNNQPLQQIYYGAPGTGKSYEINQLTKGCEDVFRTTFHPDSDYSTFVGAYKPEEDAVQRTYIWMNPTTGKAELLPVVNTTGNADLDQEKKITYKFDQQAFVKAYIRAWEKFSKVAESITSNLSSNVVVTNGNSQWRVTGISGDQVSTVPITPFSRTMRAVANCAKDGSLNIPDTTKIDSDLWAICHWFCNGYSDDVNKLADNWADMKHRFDDGEQLIIEGAGYQKWEVQKIEDNKITLRAIKDTNSTKQELESIFGNTKTGTGKNIAIVNYMKDVLHASSFEDGWTKLVDAVQHPDISNKKRQHVDPVYLIIEEINRGNCAQIFGDLFQLLDRNEAGFSTYAINADSDLEKELQKCLSGVSLDERIMNYINSLYEEHYDDIAEKVLTGELLLLPNNLYIWATMNTSDQSLFPIDSAFKRRWEWKYVKITDAKKGWQIEGLGEESWYDFILQINKVIAKMTSSADKQLGYFFCKPDVKSDPTKDENDIISLKTFVGKVVFYLWNDVFKDYGFEDKSLFEIGDKQRLSFPDFYNAEGDNVEKEVVLAFLKNVMCWGKSDAEKKKIAERFDPKDQQPEETATTTEETTAE